MSEGLYNQPVLVVEPGMHTATINIAEADAHGRWAVTASDDCTVRVWSLVDGSLDRVIRLPTGPEGIGKAYAVAISPDSKFIAVGGWTRATKADWQEQLYIHEKETGRLRRIEGLPNNVLHLAFSRDGGLLAATLGGTKGVRVYARDQDWAEAARHEDYQGPSYCAAFDNKGRLVTTALDGWIRLYDVIKQQMKPSAFTIAPHGKHPKGIAFDPEGKWLAVGYHDAKPITVLDGHNLSPVAKLKGPTAHRVTPGSLGSVAWSLDGGTLYAGGKYKSSKSRLLVAWSGPKLNSRRTLPVSCLRTISSIVSLPDGDLLVAAGDPWVGRIGADGTIRWANSSPISEFSYLLFDLKLSGDGLTVDFCYGPGPSSHARFALKDRVLTTDLAEDGETFPPLQDGLPVEGWFRTFAPKLGGHSLKLEPTERALCLAIHPALDQFAIGTTFMIRVFDSLGRSLWIKNTIGAVLRLNISRDGRLLVSAGDDGTIRWHRMSDGAELLAFLPFADRSNWVAWTPQGLYGASGAAHGTLRWHVNHGWDSPVENVRVEEIPGSYRPEILPLVIQELETPRALGLAELAAYNKRVMFRTNSAVPPGSRLHLLTMGISAYSNTDAQHLRLQYADRDATDLASVILSTQSSLYQIRPQILANYDASRLGILRALKTMRDGMAAGKGSDLSVIHFSGHGALIDGALYLLPSDVDALDAVGIKATALSLEELKSETLMLSKHGRVMLLLDACHSGAATNNGEAFEMNSTSLRTGLAAKNVTVLTSSSDKEKSFEDRAWQHGAFTMALLESFSNTTADINKNHLISVIGLSNFVKLRVRNLTGERQNPEIEIRFDTTLFASTV